MTAAPTMAPHRLTARRRAGLWLALLAVAAIAVTTLTVVTARTPMAATEHIQRTSSDDVPTRTGGGDGCALRLEVGGGVLEGLDPDDRCPAPVRAGRAGGVLE